MNDDNPNNESRIDGSTDNKDSQLPDWISESLDEDKLEGQPESYGKTHEKIDKNNSIYDMPTRPIIIKLEVSKSNLDKQNETRLDVNQSNPSNEEETLPVWLTSIINKEIAEMNDPHQSADTEFAQSSEENHDIFDDETETEDQNSYEPLAIDVDQTNKDLKTNISNDWIPEVQHDQENEPEQDKSE